MGGNLGPRARNGKTLLRKIQKKCTTQIEGKAKIGSLNGSIQGCPVTRRSRREEKKKKVVGMGSSE